ncbi:MFS transporter [Nocardioides caldifontis]|uniref:MFS transporter n=1 Tax=Nocardioides caldifontis TaxID=2588938 RepID=UPI0011E0005D|nr:MFS transporter [Nocardioides caldifontis]
MKRLPLAIWAMVVGAFAMGADEFIVAGVVREIADALDISIGAVGHLESVYALGVAIGAPVFTAIGLRLGRRSMLFTTVLVFLAGNVLSALAPTYEWVMAGRIVSATAHGAFLGIAAVLAAELVEPARKGRAIAVVFSGLTASTVLGAPIGSAVGQALGWRYTFWTLVVLGGVALLGLVATLPRDRRAAHGHGEAHDHGHGHEHIQQPTEAHAHGHEHGHGAEHDHAQGEHGHGHEADTEGLDAHALAHLGGAGHGPTMREQVQALRRPTVWGALLVTLLGYGGVFTSYVYIGPQITDEAGLDPQWITPLLLLFGVGLFIGNHLGGRYADRNLPATMVGSLTALAATLFLMTFAMQSAVTAVPGMLLFGTAAFAVVAPLQLRVMQAAGHAPDVASAANISAFTLGSAIGIYLGGAAIDGGLGLLSVNWIGGLMTTTGLALAALSLRGQQNTADPTHEVDHAGPHAHDHDHDTPAVHVH